MEDVNGEVKQWLDRYLPFEETNLFGQPPNFLSQQVNPRSGCRDPVGIPVPNYPAPPPLKLNSLYWPTGAARWSRIVCLATETTKDAILDRVITAAGVVQSNTLIISQSPVNNFEADSFTDGTLATEMYLLPPRPVSDVQTLNPQTDRLWLLPLVDVRYYWQFRHTGNFEPATWNAALVSLADQLGVTITRSSISAAYDIPSPGEHWRKYANAAYMLDAVAWSIGHRITRSITGAVYSESANDAQDTLTANLSINTEPWMQVAGGEINPGNHISGIIPEKVTVVFRTDGEIAATIEELATDHGYTGYVPNTRKVIHTNFPYDSADTTEAETLATQIASDFYAWHAYRYDRTFVGIKRWSPSGFDDYAEWSIGRRRPDGTREAQTRVQTLPYNFGVEEQPQTGGECEGIFEGYLCTDLDGATSTLTAPSTATANRLVKNANGDLEYGDEYTITNRDTTLILEAWTYIIWKQINGENRIIWAACRGEVSSSCSG